MKPFMQLAVGLVSAFGMVALVFGALLLSLSEGTSFAVARSTTTVEPTQTGERPTPLPGITLVLGTVPPTVTMLPSETPSCPQPEGWQTYMVGPGDQLESLASQAGISPQNLMQANCMLTASLLPGTLLYLPVSPTQEPSFTPPPALPTVAVPPTTAVQPTIAAATRPACGAPSGWVLYTVQPQDTLFRLANAYGITVSQLQRANCISGTLIRAGTRIYVPNVATRTPTVTLTNVPPSSTPVPPTVTSTITPTASDTAVVIPTETPAEVPSLTPTQAPTEPATRTPEDTPSPPPADTSVPTSADITATIEQTTPTLAESASP